MFDSFKAFTFGNSPKLTLLGIFMKSTFKKSKSIVKVVRVALTLSAVIVATPVASYADYPHPTGAVTVQHVKSNQRINMFERFNSGKVILHPPDNSIDQNLWIEKNSDNSTFSLWVDNTNARLSTKSDPTKDGIGTEVWMSGAKGSPQQTLRAIPRGGYPGQFLLEFQINGRGTGKCLDATGGAKFVQLIIWGCNNGNDNQGFSISQRGGTLPPVVVNPPSNNGFQPLNNFVDSWVDKNYDGDGYPLGAKYQCTDWVNYLITQFRGTAAGYPGAAAKNAFTDIWARQVGGTLIRNSTTDPNSYPQPGDVVVWNSNMGGGYGHVAIADVGSNANTLKVIEQNGGLGIGSGKGSDAIRRKTYANYANVIGWVRIPAVNRNVK